MVEITDVLPESLAEKAGIKPLDLLLSADGNEINDVLDYRFYLTNEQVVLRLLRDGDEYSVTLKKGS